MTDQQTIRKKSWATTTSLGFVVNDNLPLLEQVGNSHTKDEIVNRIFGMYCTAAIAYGFDRSKATQWLNTEGCLDSLTKSEQDFVAYSTGNAVPFMEQIESIWALCWSVSCVSELDFSKACAADFVKILPDIKQDQRGSAFRDRAVLRPLLQLVSHCDLAYCLHWGCVHSGIPGKLKKVVKPYMIIERRRALEWILSDEAWDELALDT